MVVRAVSAGQGDSCEQARLRLEGDVPFEAVLVVGAVLVDVPGFRVDGGDDPIVGGAAGDPPPSVAAVGIVGGLDVLTRDQRQDADRCPRTRIVAVARFS
ncbi:hypothetical protein [Streptomyces sp. HUAS TT7]|uniref:hypothetical protein n=1 Tax=Streptomyces sp. HUAS TT7 TaxID=3447507 RepID=UPI003F655AD0